MTKKTVNGNLNFHANVKTYLPPAILDQYVDDDGELNYILAGNRTSLASRYNSLWNPVKSQVNWKGKGDNPNRTRIAR